MFEVRVGTPTALALVALAGFVAWLRSQEDEEEAPAIGFRLPGSTDPDDE